MNNTATIPATENESWGFWGTMKEDVAAAWPLAMTAIAEATCLPADAVRAFLDSAHGRHFADEVYNHMHAGLALADAIHAATQQWMTWKITRRIGKTYGIPTGLPYLTGFVIEAEIGAEMAA